MDQTRFRSVDFIPYNLADFFIEFLIGEERVINTIMWHIVWMHQILKEGVEFGRH